MVSHVPSGSCVVWKAADSGRSLTTCASASNSSPILNVPRETCHQHHRVTSNKWSRLFSGHVACIPETIPIENINSGEMCRSPLITGATFGNQDCQFLCALHAMAWMKIPSSKLEPSFVRETHRAGATNPETVLLCSPLPSTLRQASSALLGTSVLTVLASGMEGLVLQFSTVTKLSHEPPGELVGEGLDDALSNSNFTCSCCIVFVCAPDL